MPTISCTQEIIFTSRKFTFKLNPTYTYLKIRGETKTKRKCAIQFAGLKYRVNFVNGLKLQNEYSIIGILICVVLLRRLKSFHLSLIYI